MSYIKKKCENCDSEFEIEYRMREQKYCCKQCSNEARKLKKEYFLHCNKCDNLYSVIITEYKFNRGDYKKHCSAKCANGKVWSDEHKQKLSEICKKSEKVKTANKLIGEKRILKNIENGIKYKKIKESKDVNSNKNDTKTDKKYTYIRIVEKEFICEHCGEMGISKRQGTKKQRFHKDCWLKISGGIRQGSSRGHSGWYKGYWCDSSYELVYLICNLEHGIKIERNKKGYEYIFNNKKHIYYPDFRVNGKLVEIKNYRSELTDVKLSSVDEEITIYYKDTIKPYLDYVKNKYGKNFINLYENNMEVPIVSG